MSEPDRTGARESAAPVEWPGQLDPGMRRALERSAELAAGRPSRYSLPFPEARARLLEERRWWQEDAPALAPVIEEELRPGDAAGRLAVRRFVPADAPRGRAGPTPVFIHGGGWCVGSTSTHHGILAGLARACGREVVGIDYALAPEHPFPAAPEDIASALDHLVRTGIGRFVLVGDSAGANLALAEAMRRRDRTRPQAAGLVLFYGVYTPLGEGGSAGIFGDGRYGLSRAAQERYQSAYFGPRLPSGDWRAFPLAGDLRALPSTLVVAAEFDILRDDSIALAGRLEAAGNRVRFLPAFGLAHGYLSFTRLVPSARAHLREAARFIDSCAGT